MSNTYYVYALKDSRSKPSQIFYIGKGTGGRAKEHLIKADSTRKGLLIKEIQSQGAKVEVQKLVEDVTEMQALKIELELISSFGTIDSGGMLYNTVIPKTIKRKIDNNIYVAPGSLEKAQLGLKLLKNAITELASENCAGITNSDCAHYLGLQSDNEGKQQDYLTYSILGVLLKEGLLISKKEGGRRRYCIQGI